MIDTLSHDARVLEHAWTDYRAALAVLAADGRSVTERKQALAVRDAFEQRLRLGASRGGYDLGLIARYAAEQAERAQINDQGGGLGRVGG